MSLLPMLLAFIAACVVINICLTKKQMKIARAFFLGFGIIISTCSIFLIYADWQWSQIEQLSKAAATINSLVTVLLSVSTLVFGTVTLVIVVATIILSIHAIRKIAEYIKSKKRLEQHAPSKKEEPIEKPIFACARKIFVLHCRWNN